MRAVRPRAMVGTQMKAGEVELGGLCPLCRGTPDPRESWSCAVCETVLCLACKEFAGGCVRFACSAAATPETRLTEYLRERSKENLGAQFKMLRDSWSLAIPLVAIGLIGWSFVVLNPVMVYFSYVFLFSCCFFLSPLRRELDWILKTSLDLLLAGVLIWRNVWILRCLDSGDVSRQDLLEMLEISVRRLDTTTRSGQLYLLWRDELEGLLLRNVEPSKPKPLLGSRAG